MLSRLIFGAHHADFWEHHPDGSGQEKKWIYSEQHLQYLTTILDSWKMNNACRFFSNRPRRSVKQTAPFYKKKKRSWNSPRGTSRSSTDTTANNDRRVKSFSVPLDSTIWVEDSRKRKPLSNKDFTSTWMRRVGAAVRNIRMLHPIIQPHYNCAAGCDYIYLLCTLGLERQIHSLFFFYL